jgi:hypothetical protein
MSEKHENHGACTICTLQLLATMLKMQGIDGDGIVGGLIPEVHGPTPEAALDYVRKQQYSVDQLMAAYCEAQVMHRVMRRCVAVLGTIMVERSDAAKGDEKQQVLKAFVEALNGFVVARPEGEDEETGTVDKIDGSSIDEILASLLGGSNPNAN